MSTRFSSRPPVLPKRPQRRNEAASQDQHPSEGHAEGVPAFPDPLPGSHHYDRHAETPVRRELDVGPADAYYGKGGMAHGVPARPSYGGRPAPRGEQQHLDRGTRELVDEETRTEPRPIPVYIVPLGGGTAPLARATLQSKNVPAPGADPVILVNRNPHRTSVRLLNETATAVRITFDLTLSGGALLPASMTSYLEIDTEDEICAYVPAGGSGAALVSVIEQYGVPGGG